MTKYLLLTFDIEELGFIQRTKSNRKQLFEAGKKGTKVILDFLKKKKIKATFFVTAEFSKYAPKIVKRILKEGHELASHGYSHTQSYKNMPEEKALHYIKKSKKELEIFGKKLSGFRAPRLESPALSIIKKAGFTYDSSLHPTWVPGRYNNLFRTRKPYKEKGLFVIPNSVTPLTRFPISWFWFRNFGLTYAKICTNLALMDSKYLKIYFHPWEFIDLSKKSQIPYIMKKNTGKKLVKNLGEYIDWCLSKGLEPITVKEFVEKELK